MNRNFKENNKKEIKVRFNRRKEIKKFMKMHEEFDAIRTISENTKKLTYMTKDQKLKIEEMLCEAHINLLRNIEWQRKIIGFSKETVGDVEELIESVNKKLERIKKEYEKEKNQ